MDKIRKVLLPVFTFILLLVPFNVQIVNRIIPNTFFVIIAEFVSVCGIFLLGRIKHIKKYDIVVLLILLFISFLVLKNNYYFIEGRDGTVLQFLIYLFLIIAIAFNKESIKYFYSQVGFFGLENVLATLFIALFPSVYRSIILPFISGGDYLIASDNFAQGYNPGITAHYSINGIYTSISSMYFFTKYLNTRQKKDFIYFILSFIALLLTAKRAHILITFFVCFLTAFKTISGKFSKKIFYSINSIIAVIVIFFIATSFIPELGTFIERFSESSSAGDLLNGRENLYNLCISLWEKNVFFGNGWGAFSYYFNLKYANTNYIVNYADAHNIYLQLLCEVGLINMIIIVGLFIYSFMKTRKMLFLNKGSKRILLFTYAYQLMFLIYGLSGNPLYDIQCYSIYFIVIGIVLSLKMNSDISLERVDTQ